MRPMIAGVTRTNAVREMLSGVTLAAIAIPLNIGYAQIAGLPPTAGLYALIVPTLLYALVVSSRQVVVSPDAAAAALVASSIGGLATAGSAEYMTMALAQAIISGVLFLLMAVFRLGFLASFLSEPILIGFVGGLAVEILLSQTAKMLGIHLSGDEFLEQIVSLFEKIPDANGWSLLIALGSLGILILGRRLLPLVPWALVVLVGATVIVSATDAETAGVAVLGEVASGAPEFTWPDLAWHEWLVLIPSALALTMVTTVEGLLVSRSYAERRKYTVDANRDLAAFGVANVASGLSGSFAVGSSTSRTAAMDQAGSRTQMPSVVLAVLTLVLLLFGTALLESIPSPAIGAIVAMAVAPLVGLRRLREFWGLDRFEFGVAAVCFLVTLLVGPIWGILVAFVLSLVNIVKRAAHPPVDVLEVPAGGGETTMHVSTERAQAVDRMETAPGVVVVRVSAPLFFGNAEVVVDTVKRIVDAAPEALRHLVIDMEAVTDIDLTAAEGIVRLREWLDEHGIELGFSRLRSGARPRLERLSVVRPDDRVFSSNRGAVVALAENDTPPEADEILSS